MRRGAGGHAASRRECAGRGQAAKNELLRLSKNFPRESKRRWLDTTTVIGESIRDVLITLLQAILLVIIVIYVFCRIGGARSSRDYHSRFADRDIRFRELLVSRSTR